MTLRLTFGETEVNVNTTSMLSRLLAATHRRYWNDSPSAGSENTSEPAVTVDIAPPNCSPEFALREAQRQIAAEVAAHHGWRAVKAVVAERNGRALALVGAPGSGKSTIAAHLVSRGWRLISDDVAFIDDRRSMVVAHQGLMSFRSGALPHLPQSFRATLERSHWFVDERGELEFYEVDPASVFGAEAWSVEAVLEAIVVVDERAGAAGIDTIGPDDVALYAIDGQPVSLRTFPDLRIGMIRNELARCTADYIENWYDRAGP
jgi:hypothetical protein